MISAFLTLAMALAAGTGSNHVSTKNWILYHNAATGISFRYPRSLRVHKRDPEKFGLPDVELIVDLVGDTAANPGTIVLRFILKRGVVDPETAAERSGVIRAGCQSATAMLLGGDKALVCVSAAGPAAGPKWVITVLSPRETRIFSILTDADGYDTTLPPHDGVFPLLSIIKTLHFEPPGKRPLRKSHPK